MVNPILDRGRLARRLDHELQIDGELVHGLGHLPEHLIQTTTFGHGIGRSRIQRIRHEAQRVDEVAFPRSVGTSRTSSGVKTTSQEAMLL